MFSGQIKVVAEGTDNYSLEVNNISMMDQLLPAMKTKGLLDSSNYPREHPLYSSVGKAELGHIKNECASTPLIDAIFLGLKCHQLLLENGKENQRDK